MKIETSSAIGHIKGLHSKSQLYILMKREREV
jgi:hypothetical protein